MFYFIEYFFGSVYAYINGEPFNIIMVAEIGGRNTIVGHSSLYSFPKDIINCQITNYIIKQFTP